MTEKDLEIQELRQKLKEYEDTGLTPEEIERILERGTPLEGGTAELMKAYLSFGSIDHLRELVEAEKDGRLVVLPCRVGDTVYRVFGGEIQTHCISNLIYRGIQNRW